MTEGQIPLKTCLQTSLLLNDISEEGSTAGTWQPSFLIDNHYQRLMLPEIIIKVGSFKEFNWSWYIIKLHNGIVLLFEIMVLKFKNSIFWALTYFVWTILREHYWYEYLLVWFQRFDWMACKARFMLPKTINQPTMFILKIIFNFK